mmetsp:Transcript_10382/g.17112  ORF Transcript_10382/g.17112 Transcript_10382/m.17112 type:complete len:513 (+) Transcript_10382:94-1632(+)
MLISKLPENIQRQDEMTTIIGSSLKKIAKKIHRLELMMHNEPTEDAEAYEKKIWHDKMNKLLHYDVAKRLPTLKEIQLEKIQQQKIISSKNASKIRLKPKKKPMFMMTMDKTSETKPMESIQKGGMNAPTINGEVIGVVKNYKGLNTSCGDERTLRRLDGRHSKLGAVSAVPEKMGPDHYTDGIQFKETERPDSSFQLSFRNTGRVIKNAEHYKAARFEQLSKTSSFNGDDFEDDTRMGFSSSLCSRGHEDAYSASDVLCTNPWSSASAESTIGRPVSQSGRNSPQNVFIHSPKKPLCSYESVVSEFIGLPSDSAFNQSIGLDESVNLNTLDSLVLKAADVEKRKYMNADFAMGSLDLQSEIPVMTLNDAGEVITVSQDSRPNTATNTGRKSNQHSKHKASEIRPKSRAQKAISNIRHDLSRSRSSKLRDENISLTDSLSVIIDDWQLSESVKPSGQYGQTSKRRRKKKRGGAQGCPDVVNLDQLLMDDTGMSFEEARSLVEEYSESINFNE